MVRFSEGLEWNLKENRLSHCCLGSRWVVVKNDIYGTTAR